MELTRSERHSALWLKIVAHLDEKLMTRRVQLEAPLDLDSTNRTRGRIAELKDLLKLNEEPLEPVA